MTTAACAFPVAAILLLAVPASAQTGGECAPACRSGFVCVQGGCVSRCNPPCAAGERCTDQGECAAAPVVAPAVPVSPSGSLGTCFTNEQCVPPSVCVQGQCRVSTAAVDALHGSAVRHLVAGGIVLLLGVAAVVIGATLETLEESHQAGPNSGAAVGAGWTLISLGSAATLAATIVMGVGGARLRRAGRVSAAQVLVPWLSPLGGGLAVRGGF